MTAILAPLDQPALRVLSLGGGVQSTAMAHMAAHGEIGPMPDFAVFADTGAEPAPTLEHIKWLGSGNVLPFPVVTVSAGSLRDTILARAKGAEGKRFTAAPFFTESGGMGRRQCTREFKIDPINRNLRKRMGYKPRQRIPAMSVEMWLGITTDELRRAACNRVKWIANRYPLLEQRLNRAECIQWLERHGYPVPIKSACTFCPYRTDFEWRILRDTDKTGFDDAVKVDAAIREAPTLKTREFVHRGLKPLSEVDLRTATERGQGQFDMGPGCEGGCGL